MNIEQQIKNLWCDFESDCTHTTEEIKEFYETLADLEAKKDELEQTEENYLKVFWSAR
jgi:hypothetical protein